MIAVQYASLAAPLAELVAAAAVKAPASVVASWGSPQKALALQCPAGAPGREASSLLRYGPDWQFVLTSHGAE